MNVKKRLVISLGLFIFSSAVSTAEEFPGLEKLMNESQLKQTGVEKLTPEELEALNKWINRYLGNEIRVVEKQIKQAKIEKEKPKRIVSQISGEFTGWRGNTIFRLKNGQVWQQRHQGTLHYKAVEPKIEITRNFLGFYVLQVVGTSYSIGVKRIR